MRVSRRTLVLLSCLVLASACSSGGSSKAGDPDGGAGDDTTADGGADGADGGTSTGPGGPALSGDTLAPSPVLTVPGVAPQLADALLQANTFADSYDATLDVLAQGGIATKFGTTVKRAAKAPAASAFLFPVSAIDLALEASDRETMATFTLTELAQAMNDLDWPTPADVHPADHWRELLASWYAEAAKNPDAPDSFAVLFIAAMNQKQDPPANIATGSEDPSLIRLSALEVELLLAAFDRTLKLPNTTAAPRLIDKAPSASPCSDFVKQTGTLGQIAQVGAGELAAATIGAGLEKAFGTTTAGKLGDALNALGTLGKIGKLIQQFRYGYVKLSLDTPNPVKKPLKGAAHKQGKLTATAGVDPMKYDDKVAEAGGAENSAQRQALADCFNSLNLPTPTDARDIASDAENWRVSWSIVGGDDTQVLWSPGEQWDIDGRFENQMSRLNDTTVANSVRFDILPQPTKATVGKERHRKAVFKVQLRRGGLPELNSLWGSGKAGAAAAFANPIGAALGIADALVDISTKWVLEGASPSAYKQQDLIEIEPTGLVGTIKWTVEGSAKQVVNEQTAHTLEQVNVRQTGYLEIVSEKDEQATVYGSEICHQDFTDAGEVLEIVEGSEVVGEKWDQFARRYSDSWSTPSAMEPRPSLATVVDGSTQYAGIDPSLLPPEVRNMVHQVTIYLDISGVSCGENRAKEEQASIDWTYMSGWTSDEKYEVTDVTLTPSYVDGTMLVLDRKPGQNEIKGSNIKKSTRTINGLDVPMVQTLVWDLHYVE